jgi:hypothetical protein
MKPNEFSAALAGELRLLGVPFDRGALLSFVESAWPLIEDDPDPGRWVGAFLSSRPELAEVKA